MSGRQMVVYDHDPSGACRARVYVGRRESGTATGSPEFVLTTVRAMIDGQFDLARSILDGLQGATSANQNGGRNA
jgi:hypothetical protein